MKKIVPHLWFDKEAKEAAAFYVVTFGGNSKVGSVTTLHDTPSGDADIVPFELWGTPFTGTKEQIDRLTQAFLPMKKFDIATLKKAFESA
jgi:predicted 3-demethylubiquinone-9 3-methyltransferase (glyoxalase superfamily)